MLWSTNNRRSVLRAGIGAAALALAAFVGQPGSAAAESFTLRVGSGHPAVLPYVAQLKDFFVPEVKRRVAEETEHDVDFVEAYGGSVAKLPEVLDAVQSGLLDIGALSTPFEPRNLFLQNYGYYVPFGVSDPVRAGEIARRLYEEVPELKTTIEEQNQVLLAVLAASNYNIITTEPWQTLEDLQGRKLMAAGANAAWLQGSGATPVQAGLPEAYNALQTGVFDGVLMHYQGMQGFKLYEPAPYIGVVDFGALPINLLTMNQDRYESLPEDVRQIINEVAAEYEKRVNVANAEKDKTAREQMVEEGAEVLEISPEVQEKWAGHLADVPKKGAQEGEELGLPMRELLKRYIAILEEGGNEVVKQYKVE